MDTDIAVFPQVVNGDTEEQIAITRPKSAKRPLPKITLFDCWCKGCGICSWVCPTQAIEADHEGRPTAIHPERCIACQACVIHCPDLAITVSVPKPEEGQ